MTDKIEQEQSYEEYIAPYLARGWKQETCKICRGYGVVSHYSYNDFEGAKDCEHCASGTVWRTPSGKHLTLYPGGPFCG